MPFRGHPWSLDGEILVATTYRDQGPGPPYYPSIIGTNLFVYPDGTYRTEPDTERICSTKVSNEYAEKFIDLARRLKEIDGYVSADGEYICSRSSGERVKL